MIHASSSYRIFLRSIVVGAVAWSTLSSGLFNKTFFAPRSQGVNAARDLVGWQPLINLGDQGCFYGALALNASYNRSWNANRVARFLLGAPLMTVTGSRVISRGPTDLLADYFGLPSDYKSYLCFEPHINNVIFDIQAYFGLDNIAPGLYFRFDAPVTHSVWDLHMQEYVKVPGTNFFPAGYMASTRINRSDLTVDMTDYFDGDNTFGDMQEPIKYGKIMQRYLANAFAEIRAAFGWNYANDWYHIGPNIRVAIPTGTRPTGEFLFEPVVGNCKHWELGAGLTSHVDVWQSCDGVHLLGLYLDANFTHLFTSQQKRSFDFIPHGQGSRYMLFAQVLPPSTDLFLGSAVGPAAPRQYRSRLVPGVNISTLKVNVSVAIQADIAFKLSYHRKHLGVDLGYNFWARSKEKLCIADCFQSNTFVAKGDAQLYGFDRLNNATVIPLSASQSAATLHAGQGDGNATFTNANADLPLTAADSNGPLLQLNAADSAALAIDQANVATSSLPVLLQASNLDLDSATMPQALTHKLFFNITYIALEDDCIWKPFFGVGGEIEFAQGGLSCGLCSNSSAYSQWSVWAKGGFGF